MPAWNHGIVGNWDGSLSVSLARAAAIGQTRERADERHAIARMQAHEFRLEWRFNAALVARDRLVAEPTIALAHREAVAMMSLRPHRAADCTLVGFGDVSEDVTGP